MMRKATAPLRLCAFVPLGLWAFAPLPLSAHSPALREAAEYYSLGKTQKALETCITALDANPLDEDLYAYALEILPEGPSEYAGSFRRITDKAAAAQPGSHIYYLGSCKLYRMAGRMTEALTDCKKGRALDPTSWQVYRELGLTYSRNGDNRSVETLAQGAELAPDNYKAFYYLAAEYERRKESEAAVRNYRKSLTLLNNAKDLDAQAYSRLVRGKLKRLTAAPRTAPAAKSRGPEKARTSPASSAPVPKMLVGSCLREAEELKKTGDPAAIEKKLAICAAAAPGDPQVKIDRAACLEKLGRLEEAIAQYQQAAGLLSRNAPLAALCQRKTAQAYSRLNDNPRAIAHYGKALEINEKDTEAAMGLAAAYEAAPDLKKAEEFYARALKYDPGNARAGERLDEIRFSLLSGAQLMEELRDRGAADGKKPAPGADDIALLNAMRLAERNGAVDYLRSKTAYIRNLVVEKREQGRVRLLLTPAGLKSYQNFISRDAVSFFEKQGIALQDIFTLRDLTGQPVFDKSGRLTPEGMRAYWQGKAGTKSWIMHYEAVAKTPEDEKLNEQIKDLLKHSFREISEPEYLWLARVTTCPDDVLQDTKTPLCKMRILRTARARRYFLFYQDQFPGCNLALNLALVDYRAGETDTYETNRGTNFFGTGGNEKHRLCENGKLWE